MNTHPTGTLGYHQIPTTNVWTVGTSDWFKALASVRGTDETGYHVAVTKPALERYPHLATGIDAGDFRTLDEAIAYVAMCFNVDASDVCERIAQRCANGL